MSQSFSENRKQGRIVHFEHDLGPFIVGDDYEVDAAQIRARFAAARAAGEPSPEKDGFCWESWDQAEQAVLAELAAQPEHSR